MNYFHVPMWFAMMLLFTYSVWSFVQYLRTQNIRYDDQAIESVKVAFFFGGLGLVTGMLWGNATWGTFWTPCTGLTERKVLSLNSVLCRGTDSSSQARSRPR